MLNSAQNLSHNPISGNTNPVFSNMQGKTALNRLKNSMSSAKSVYDTLNIGKALTGEGWNNMSSAQKVSSIASIIAMFCE